MLIQGFLELSPGIFAIFYHHALGITSAKKADDRALSFILGVEISTAIIFLIVYIVISFFIAENSFNHSIFLWVMSGIFLAEAIVAFFFYYRKPFKKSSKKSTALFLPRHLAENLISHAEKAKNRSDTITLGIISTTLELFFTLPLYIICAYEIFNISVNSNFIFIIVYIIIATIPLFTVRTLFRTDHNLAEIQQLRVKKKFWTKLTISGSFLALFVITFIIGFTK